MNERNQQKQKNLLRRLLDLVIKNRYFFRRIGTAILTLMLSTLLIFIVVRMIPGDSIDQFARTLVDQRKISYDEARTLAIQILGYNPDESAIVQFKGYVSSLLQGNLGSSIYIDRLTVNQVIAQFLPRTLFISSLALIISFVLGTSFGAYMAWKVSKKKEAAITSYLVISSAIPDYILGLILLYFLAHRLGWFPAFGAYDSSLTPGLNIEFIASMFYHATLPVMAMVFVQTAGWAMVMRGSCVNVLGEDYIYAAQVRGLPNKIIVKKHLKRNAMLPIVTSLGIAFGTLFGGSPLIENIFSYPGLGQMFSLYIVSRDYYMVVGILFFTSFIMIMVNLIVDSIYNIIDPRVRRDT